MFKKRIVSIITMISMLSLVGCNGKIESVEEKITQTEIFMGTPITITLYNGEEQEILENVFDKVEEIENLVSINKKDTEIDRLNKNAGISPVKLSDISYDILEKAVEYSKISQGGYDVSIGPLVKLWSIGLEGAKVPTNEEIEQVKKLVDYSKIQLNDEKNEAFLMQKGMIVDLGSIAKGYAADEIVKVLKQEDVEKAIIDLGGNIYAMGSKEENKNWNIGIQDPFNSRGSVVGTLELSNKSIVTTGIYERFIEEDGEKYHHILNSETGYPFETEIAGVSIISDSSIDADALSTLVFTKGLEQGLEFVENIPNTDAIFITKNKEVYTTKDIREEFKIINDEFKLCN